MQEYIETHEIRVARMKKLRGWKRRVGVKRFRGNPAADLDQPLEPCGNPSSPAPPHNVRRDLVRHAKRENRPMPAASHDRLAHRLLGLPAHVAVVQKTALFRPWNVHEQAESLFLGQIQQPQWRHIVNPQAIRPQLPDHLEVPCHPHPTRKWCSVGSGTKAAIGNSLEPELLSSTTEELPSHGHALPRNSRSRACRLPNRRRLRRDLSKRH